MNHALSLLLSCAALPLSEIHVPGDYPTIQAAVVAARAGDVVVVDPGSYVENVDFLGKAITVRSREGPGATALRGPTAPGSVAVSFVSGEGPATLLQGFSLEGSGSLDFAPPVLVRGTSPTLRDLVLTNAYGFSIWVEDGAPAILECEVYGTGALESGIRLLRSNAEIGWCALHDLGSVAIALNEGSSPEIHHCAIRDCAQGIQVGWVQPAVADPGRPRVHHCVLARNFRDVPNGNSVFVWAGYSVEVTDSLFLDHPWSSMATMANPLAGDEVLFERNRVFTSFEGGSQVQTYDVERVVVRGNVVAADPGVVKTGSSFGIDVLYYDRAWIEGNTVAGFSRATEVYAPASTSTVHSGGIYHDLGPWGDYVGVPPSDSAVPNLATAGPGCILVLDPLFVDRAARDYHLLGVSPCVDVGPATGSLVDADGDPRIAPYEMGADELPPRSHWIAGDPLARGSMRLVAQGSPGERVAVGWSLAPPPRGLAGIVGWWAVLGRIGADGLLVRPAIPVPPLSVPQTFRTQAVVGSTRTAARHVIWGG